VVEEENPPLLSPLHSCRVWGEQKKKEIETAYSTWWWHTKKGYSYVYGIGTILSTVTMKSE
jgi:hypothetical protein